MTIGAIFARQFHRSAPRAPAGGAAQRVRNTSTAPQEVPTTTKRTDATTAATNFEEKTHGINEEIWKAYGGLDEGWGPWFLVP
jgi:hypothetical protein